MTARRRRCPAGDALLSHDLAFVTTIGALQFANRAPQEIARIRAMVAAVGLRPE